MSDGVVYAGAAIGFVEVGALFAIAGGLVGKDARLAVIGSAVLLVALALGRILLTVPD